MSNEKSPHNMERDRIAEGWRQLSPFICAGCQTKTPFPMASSVNTEVRYSGRLRADVAALDATGQVAGVVEVVCSHPPTREALAAQESLGFAYYRLLPLPWRNEPSVWLCSPECWEFYTKFPYKETSSPWEARRCEGCDGYFHENRISWVEFRDWGDDPNSACCIHCAATRDGQWRTPGDLAGGDPREWTPDDDSDPTILFLAYSDAAFWSMVWRNRVAKLDEPDDYYGSRNEAAEDATVRRLPMVNAAFDAGEWDVGANLLLPIGAPGWADYHGEPERLLAFRPDNCRGTSEAWLRLLSYRLDQLPIELSEIIRQWLWGNCLSCAKLIQCSEPRYPICVSCDAPRRSAEKEELEWPSKRLSKRPNKRPKESEKRTSNNGES